MRYKLLPLFIAFIASSISFAQSTMDFTSGASHTGFTFPGGEWNSAAGTIWIANLANPSHINKDVGKFDFISFKVGPVTGTNMIRLSSDKGDTLIYDESIATTHTLNWDTVSALKFERVSGGGGTADIDDVVYCERPDENLTMSPGPSICEGDTANLSFTGGSLGGGATWQWYASSCGGATTGTGTAIDVSPTSVIQYFVRAEGGCLISPGSCIAGPIVFTHTPPSTPTISNTQDSLTASVSGDKYNWYYNGNLLPNDTTQSIAIVGNGSYEVEVIEGICTSNLSVTVNITTASIDEKANPNLHLFPNPTDGLVRVTFSAGSQFEKLKIIDASGRVLISKEIASTQLGTNFDLGHVENGIYYLVSDNGIVLPLIKQ